MIQSPNIFSWIKEQENQYETEEITLGDNWYWNMRRHIQMIYHLKHGIFFTGENQWLRSFRKIMKPILNLCYWTEDLEVKDVLFYATGDNGIDKVASFLIKKYHDDFYTKENNLDLLFDEITESDIDYGGVLVQKGVKVPVVIPLNSIAFCDQSDILSGALGFRHNFSPTKLMSMKQYGWGDEKNGATISIDDLITLASFEKESGTLGDRKNKSTAKTIDVYVVIGDMPSHYLNDDNNMEDYIYQIQIVAEYTDSNKNKQGVVLYRKDFDDKNFKFYTTKKVFQRGLGEGIGEDILGDQIWTNFLNIHKTNLLESASKILLQTDDRTLAERQNLNEMDNLQIAYVDDNKSIRQIPNVASANIQLFQNEINSWYEHAQAIGSAYDPVMGKESSSGTTFRGQERLVAQGTGMHNKRRGQRAKFIEEIYRDIIIPDIKKEILKGKKFIGNLSMDELNWIAEQISINETNKIIKKKLLETGKAISQDEQDLLIKTIKEGIIKKGNKQMIEILKKEFDDIELTIGINIAGKQKDIAGLSDKLLSIFQFIIANPDSFKNAMQIPAMSKAFNNILEYGGMNVSDFNSLMSSQIQETPTMEAQAQLQPAQLTTGQEAPQINV
jgi:hypothetical protein